MTRETVTRRRLLASAGAGLALGGVVPATGSASRCSSTRRRRYTGTVDRGTSATHVYELQSDAPCSVTVTVSGERPADLDLYVTLDGRTPSPTDYDRRSWSVGPEESLTLRRSGLDPDATLGIGVHAYSEGGSYEVRVEETGEGFAPQDRSTEDDAEFKFLFTNAYLFDGVPGVNGHRPAQEERAAELGRAIREEGFDAAALCEVFADSDRQTVIESTGGEFDPLTGPTGNLLQYTSGLLTLVNTAAGNRVTAYDHHQYDAGSNLVAKGVLYAQVDFGPGAVDVFSTHNYRDIGIVDGWIGPSEGHYQRQQLGELVSFVEEMKRTHDPERRNPTVVCGDFNIAAGEEKHGYLEWMADRLGLYDAWRRHADGRGPTWNARKGKKYDGGNMYPICEFDRGGDSPHYCTETDPETGVRIDYVFLEEERDSHDVTFDVRAIKRRPWWRDLDASPGESRTNYWQSDERETPNYLSDHMGLEVRFDAAKR